MSNGTKTPQLQINNKNFSAAGMRLTSQRALIIDILLQGPGHPDADEIYRRARVSQPRLSLSTVYRTLQALKKLGLVKECHFDESHHHYEAKPAAEHHHLVCLNCGRIIEFQQQLTRYLKKNVPEVKDFEITNTEVRITGYCPRCRQEQR